MAGTLPRFAALVCVLANTVGSQVKHRTRLVNPTVHLQILLRARPKSYAEKGALAAPETGVHMTNECGLVSHWGVTSNRFLAQALVAFWSSFAKLFCILQQLA